MSSCVGSADATHWKVTSQQNPVEPMGSETPAAASSVAVPLVPDGTKPFGATIPTVDRPGPGKRKKAKLAVEPGGVPYGMNPLLPSGKLGTVHAGLVKMAGALPFWPSSSQKLRSGNFR